jgi:hypothetical protein
VNSNGFCVLFCFLRLKDRVFSKTGFLIVFQRKIHGKDLVLKRFGDFEKVLKKFVF